MKHRRIKERRKKEGRKEGVHNEGKIKAYVEMHYGICFVIIFIENFTIFFLEWLYLSVCVFFSSGKETSKFTINVSFLGKTTSKDWVLWSQILPSSF